MLSQNWNCVKWSLSCETVASGIRRSMAITWKKDPLHVEARFACFRNRQHLISQWHEKIQHCDLPTLQTNSSNRRLGEVKASQNGMGNTEQLSFRSLPIRLDSSFNIGDPIRGTYRQPKNTKTGSIDITRASIVSCIVRAHGTCMIVCWLWYHNSDGHPLAYPLSHALLSMSAWVCKLGCLVFILTFSPIAQSTMQTNSKFSDQSEVVNSPGLHLACIS